MVLRSIIRKSKDKLIILLIVLIITGSYLYLSHLQESYETMQWSGERCSSELTSVKYQLGVVTDYKNKIDKLLMESQKAHDFDKERFKDIMESCVAMKQQAAICQSQFEDLQSECKKVREDYDNLLNVVRKTNTAGQKDV